MTYIDHVHRIWTSGAFPVLAEDPAPILPLELELQAMWFAGAFGRDFLTDDGRPVRIVQFGEWNRMAGPDFLHCVAQVGGQTLHGPLELDRDAQDWEIHGHSANPAFRETILHVVFHSGGAQTFTRTDEHRHVPRMTLPETLVAEALNRPRREVAVAHPGRCLRPLASLAPAALQRLFDGSAKHRAELKARRFLRTADAHGRDVALYQAVAETLGYRGNSLAMRLLAQRMPLQELRTHPPEALLFGTAGFLSPTIHEQAPPATRDYLRSLWDIWWKHRGAHDGGPDRKIPWQLHGQRPANHPQRRIGALAALVHAWPKFRAVAMVRPFSPQAVIEFLEHLEHPFWSKHHTLTSRTSNSSIALFGKNRANELLANHLIPLALLEDDSFAFEQYTKLRAHEPNDAVKRCALRLFGSLDAAKPWLRKLAWHQAMLQIYHDFCLEDLTDCAQCPFPEQLAQWAWRKDED